MSAVASPTLKHGGDEHDLPERRPPHLASVAGFSRDWLLTFSSRWHKQGSRIGGEPSSVVRRVIIPPAHRCWPNFGAPPRAANIPPRMSAAPPEEPRHARDISPPPRKSGRHAARALDQRRRSEGRRRAIHDLCRHQLRSPERQKGRATDDHYRFRSESLAQIRSLFTGASHEPFRQEHPRPSTNARQPQRCERGGCSKRYSWSLRERFYHELGESGSQFTDADA